MDREGGTCQQIGLGVSVCWTERRFCAILRVTSVEQIPKRTLFLDLPENIIVSVIVY